MQAICRLDELVVSSSPAPTPTKLGACQTWTSDLPSSSHSRRDKTATVDGAHVGEDRASNAAHADSTLAGDHPLQTQIVPMIQFSSRTRGSDQEGPRAREEADDLSSDEGESSQELSSDVSPRPRLSLSLNLSPVLDREAEETNKVVSQDTEDREQEPVETGTRDDGSVLPVYLAIAEQDVGRQLPETLFSQRKRFHGSPLEPALEEGEEEDEDDTLPSPIDATVMSVPQSGEAEKEDTEEEAGSQLSTSQQDIVRQEAERLRAEDERAKHETDQLKILQLKARGYQGFDIDALSGYISSSDTPVGIDVVEAITEEEEGANGQPQDGKDIAVGEEGLSQDISYEDMNQTAAQPVPQPQESPDNGSDKALAVRGESEHASAAVSPSASASVSPPALSPASSTSSGTLMRSIFQPLKSVRLAFAGFRASRTTVPKACHKASAENAAAAAQEEAAGSQEEIGVTEGGQEDDSMVSEAALVLLPPNLRQQMTAMRSAGRRGMAAGAEAQKKRPKEDSEDGVCAADETEIPMKLVPLAAAFEEHEGEVAAAGAGAASVAPEDTCDTGNRSVSRTSTRSADDVGIDLSIATVEGSFPGLALSHASNPSNMGDAANWRYV